MSATIVAFVAALALFFAAVDAVPARAQEDGREADPNAALTSLLSAACKHNETQFAIYLTADNAKSFAALPAGQRAAVLKRLSLSENPGRPLLSTSTDNHPILRCQFPQATAEFDLGEPRTHENLAFIPVASGGDVTDFGLVRESGGWRLISIGLMLFDIPQLASRWAEDDVKDREAAAVQALRDLATAIATYQRAFDQLPNSLAQLGPAPKGQVSPEQADLINSQIATGSEGEYKFRYRVVTGADGNPSGFEIAAMPEAYGKSARESFLLDAAGKIHGADKHGAIATADDPLVEAAPLPSPRAASQSAPSQPPQ
jgi:type II secretory pathway pseudopilin PulG